MAFLIDDLLLLPFRLGLDIAEKIRDMAAEELEDTPEKLQRELLDLEMALEIEEITKKEYEKKEKDILARMEALKKEESKQK
ncbi:MAG: gas vesicle protein GvpG [Candidatus Nealsonbacteria bacterium CG_4_10_14_0_2_um_filter_38_17]|uniref:Gas vesicle protein GvpG n=1 Tax=Candidatus Nealsonbacteria bacterium CG_4_10_14_0_2_um_filter_38_17 TaxID=1974680 RepID=A0A2M7UZ63_9BACT|nr:MAG: gas vesicle protein GvpG [Candidatus Nealsonbacteria bacterium CG_4_10_14_0_2_um_filter_38_17]